MKDVLQKQYALLRGTREIVFNFIENTVKGDLNKPVPAYDNKTIGYLLGHNARCYFHWLAYYTLQQPVDILENEEPKTVDVLRQHFDRVDNLVAFFLNHFGDTMEVIIDGTHSGNPDEHATPLQVFTHVFTHEFHHKGQIVLMCRLLGHRPPDTDVSKFF